MFSNKNIKEEYISKQNILKHVSEFDIYRYYLPNIEINDITNSPFRKDNNPSFGIYLSMNNELMFNDYKLGSGNFLKFTMWMENVDYKSALHILNKRYNLGYISYGNNSSYIHKPIITNEKFFKKDKTKISIKSRDWNQDDIDFWYPLDIKKLYNVIPIKYFWINEQIYNADKLAYAYRYGPYIYKIYQPNRDVKNGKFWSNIDISIPWFGHNILPTKQHDVLLVVSSAKDTNVTLQCDFYTISPHTESQIFTLQQYRYYKRIFRKIIIFYDNDETGIKQAEKFSKTYDLDYIVLEDTKDQFEFVKKYDLITLKEWIQQWI